MLLYCPNDLRKIQNILKISPTSMFQCNMYIVHDLKFSTHLCWWKIQKYHPKRTRFHSPIILWNQISQFSHFNVIRCGLIIHPSKHFRFYYRFVFLRVQKTSWTELNLCSALENILHSFQRSEEAVESYNTAVKFNLCKKPSTPIRRWTANLSLLYAYAWHIFQQTNAIGRAGMHTCKSHSLKHCAVWAAFSTAITLHIEWYTKPQKSARFML